MDADAKILAAERDIAEFFEEVADGRDAKLAANWVIQELFAILKKDGMDIAASPVTAGNLGKLISLLSDGTISNRIAKDVFEEMVVSGADPETIVAEKGLTQITDTSEIEAAVEEVIANNPEQAQQLKEGNQKVAGWFVGQVMRATQGKANPQMVNALLRKKLG